MAVATVLLAGAMVCVLAAFGAAGCSRRHRDEESGSTDNAELARVRADLAASQQRMQAIEACIQALTQQQLLQSAENQGLRQQLQVMGTKMQRTPGAFSQ